jgi:small RNA 2'-O-methyltransferase
MTPRPTRRDRRRAAAMKTGPLPVSAEARERQEQVSSTDLHDERLNTVVRYLRECGARRILDLGCGSGALLERLVEVEQFTEVVGLDSSITALRQAERRLAARPSGHDARLRLLHGSFMAADFPLTGYDAAALVETIEHVPPDRLSAVERTVFGVWSPTVVVVTTPNREYNVRYGIAEGEFRHADHRFEWSRAKFAEWATGVAARGRYEVDVQGIGPRDPMVGTPSQMAMFRRDRTRRG